jgi:outer membrane receptor protein involved in Fe transport
MVLSDGRRRSEAVYAQLDHQLLTTVKLIGGFQANRIGRLKVDVVPRIGVICNPTPHFDIKALYSGAFRAPSLNETLIDYVPPAWVGGPSLMGNRNLVPEMVATVDIGVGYQGNRFQAEAGYFHNKQTDSIVLANATTAGEYVNLGGVTFHGVELEGKYYFANSFFVTGSAIYQGNRDSNGNSNVTPIANFSSKAGISYELESRVTMSLFDDFEGPLHGYTAAINPKPGAYDMLNAHVRYDLSKWLPANSRSTVALVVHANNLVNKAVWLPDWKDQPGDSIFFNRGRTVYAGLEVSLKKERQPR